MSVISFYLNGRRKDIDFDKESSLTPYTSVLHYLREHEHLMGTKEGCGVGDCGACTVCIAQLNTSHSNLFSGLNSPKCRFLAVDSCLLMLSMITGKHLFTIEWLSKDGEMHPVQRALAEKRGTQCGFCSPGMVMSAYAHYRSGRPFTRAEIERTISGNLCRCTGYESILEAMMYVGDLPALNEADPIFEKEVLDIAGAGLSFERGGVKFYKPSSLQETLRLKDENNDAIMISGATDVGISIKKGVREGATYLDISDIEELKSSEDFEGYIYVGSSTTIQSFKELISDFYPTAASYLDSFASLQIRNIGSIGGSIAASSPVGDIMPLLLSLDADIVLSSVNGKRSVEANSFITSYRKNQMRENEIISAVIVPKPSKSGFLFCHKQSNRKDMDISTMTFCIYFETTNKKISKIFTGLGGMAAVPINSCSAEEYLFDKEVTIDTFKKAGLIAAKDFTPLSDMRGSSEYRLKLVENLFIKCFEEYGSSRKKGE